MFIGSIAFAEPDAVDRSMVLGQQRLSNLFFFSRSSGPVHLRTWLRGFGNWTTLSDGAVDAKAYGVSLGVDRQFGRNILVGASLGGSWCSAEEKQQRENLDVSAFHGSLYSRIRLQRIYFDIEGTLGSNESRLSGTSSTAFQGGLGGEVGTWWESGLAKVEPYLGIRQVWYDDKSPQIGNKTTSILGLRYSWKTVGPLTVTTPRIYGGWLREWNDKDLINVGTFVDSPTVYRLRRGGIKEDRLFVGGGFTTSMGSSLDVYLRYTAEIATNYSAHTLLLGTNWNF